MNTIRNRLTVILLFISVGTTCIIAGEFADVDQQIKLATLAAPEEDRDSCTVLGYDNEGSLITLREGSNSLICLADDPNKSGFSVACYTKELDPYMQRGRDLRAEGKDFQTVFDIRESEIKAGTLPMPDKSILNVLTGDLNEETGEVENSYLRYVIYIPYATPESTGIPLKPAAPGGPWIMNPGTHRAHIMINPLKG